MGRDRSMRPRDPRPQKLFDIFNDGCDITRAPEPMRSVGFGEWSQCARVAEHAYRIHAGSRNQSLH